MTHAKHFRFCGKKLEFRPKRRKLLTATKEIHKVYPSNFSKLLNDDETEELNQIKLYSTKLVQKEDYAI